MQTSTATPALAMRTCLKNLRPPSLSPLRRTGILFISFLAAASAHGKDSVPFGQSLIVNLPFPETEVAQVVEEVVQNGIIRGSKEYNRDEYITGATAASSSRLFRDEPEGGRIFYKVRAKALAPRNFKESNDVGTLAVRYIVQSQDANHTVLRIDALFVEDFRHVTHSSDGSVESAEYKDIHDRLDAFTLAKTQPEPAQTQPPSQIELANGAASAPLVTASIPPDAPSLQQHVQDLRRQVERLVKSPGAPLKSAPFRSATTLQPLPTGAQVAIVIVTPYWLGVETQDGHRGWMLRDDLELLP